MFPFLSSCDFTPARMCNEVRQVWIQILAFPLWNYVLLNLFEADSSLQWVYHYQPQKTVAGGERCPYKVTGVY